MIFNVLCFLLTSVSYSIFFRASLCQAILYTISVSAKIAQLVKRDTPPFMNIRNIFFSSADWLARHILAWSRGRLHTDKNPKPDWLKPEPDFLNRQKPDPSPNPTVQNPNPPDPDYLKPDASLALVDNA